MFCVNCGKQLKDDVAFCDNCGYSFGAPEQPAAEPTAGEQSPYAPVGDNQTVYQGPVYQAPQKSKTGPIIGIVVGGLVLIIGIIVLALVLMSGSGSQAKNGYDTYEELIEDYYVAFERGDERAIEAMMSAEIAEYSMQDEDTDNVCEALDYWYDYYGYNVSSWEITNITEENLDEYIFNDMGWNVTRFLDVETTAMISSTEVVIDVMVLELGGKWYLLSTW